MVLCRAQRENPENRERTARRDRRAHRDRREKPEKTADIISPQLTEAEI